MTEKLPSDIHTTSQVVTSELIGKFGVTLPANRVANFVYELEEKFGEGFDPKYACTALKEMSEAAITAIKIISSRR